MTDRGAIVLISAWLTTFASVCVCWRGAVKVWRCRPSGRTPILGSLVPFGRRKTVRKRSYLIPWAGRARPLPPAGPDRLAWRGGGRAHKSRSYYSFSAVFRPLGCAPQTGDGKTNFSPSLSLWFSLDLTGLLPAASSDSRIYTVVAVTAWRKAFFILPVRLFHELTDVIV